MPKACCAKSGARSRWTATSARCWMRQKRYEGTPLGRSGQTRQDTPFGALETVKIWSVLALLSIVSAGAAVAEPNDRLPDFGSPADATLSKSREAQLGRGVMLQLRNAGVVVEDPQLTEYIGWLGSQLSSHANDGDFNFNFFFVKDDRINAFALPGGYVGVNSGLLLATEN